MLRSSGIRKICVFPVLFFLSVILLSSCAREKAVRKDTTGADILYEHGAGSGPRHTVYHSVAPGETLWRISKMYNVDYRGIQKANNISDLTDIEIGTKLLIPGAAPRKHVITLYPSRKWKYIIVHHSATDFGNSEKFNKAHLNRGWRGLGYHFVIDNGTCGKSDGQIETSPRWINQMNGAHCKASGMNKKGIGICLVGNFSRGQISRQQMASLVYLVSKLQNYYNIPDSHIMGHGDVKGASTECPGTRFPWKTFRAKLR